MSLVFNSDGAAASIKLHNVTLSSDGTLKKAEDKEKRKQREKKQKDNKKQGKGHRQKANRKQFCDTWKNTFNKRENSFFYVSFMRGWRHGELWVFPIHTERLSSSFIQLQWQSLLVNIDNNHANQQSTHTDLFSVSPEISWKLWLVCLTC